MATKPAPQPAPGPVSVNPEVTAAPDPSQTTIQFFQCPYCGMTIFTNSAPGEVSAAPVCIDGYTMVQQTGMAPVSLTAVVWRKPKGF